MIRQKNGKFFVPKPAGNKELGLKYLATSMKQAVAQFARLPQACEGREHAFFPLCSCCGWPAKLFSTALQRCYPPSTTIFLKPRYRRRKSRCFYCMPQYRPIQSRCIDCMRQYRRIKSRCVFCLPRCCDRPATPFFYLPQCCDKRSTLFFSLSQRCGSL